MREQGLLKGLFKEARVSKEPIQNDQWLLINSLGCNPITKINKNPIKEFQGAEMLWQLLLKE